eukprot:gene59998-biopygen43371
MPLATRVATFALFVMSLDLLVGYCGLVSLGHAALWGVGSYATAILAVHGLSNPLAGLLAGGLAGAFTAFLSGLVLLRFSGLAFIVLTIAFSQVLLNLAGNAIKFTASGGVALIVEPGIRPNEISFLVRDTGIGIAPDAQQRIFREFEQADDSTARHYGGTGLGLSISERIVKRMNGRITLQSELGAGSTFEVALPLSSSDSGTATFVPPDLTGQSVMLVAPQSIEASLTALRLERW